MSQWLDPICERVRSQISLFVDDELSQLEQAMVASHVVRCATCRDYREGLVVTTQVLRETSFEPLERRMVLPSRRRASLRGFQAAAVAAVTLMVALGGAAGLRGLTGESAPVPAVPPPAYLQSSELEQDLLDAVTNPEGQPRFAKAI